MRSCWHAPAARISSHAPNFNLGKTHIPRQTRSHHISSDCSLLQLQQSPLRLTDNVAKIGFQNKQRVIQTERDTPQH